MNAIHRNAFDSEISIARHLMAEDRFADAMKHLERAHVLGQEHVVPHVVSHWLMFRVEVARSAPVAAAGQVIRIFLGALGSAIGRVPIGNTGGSDISMFARLPIDPSLKQLMKGTSADGSRS